MVVLVLEADRTWVRRVGVGITVVRSQPSVGDVTVTVYACASRCVILTICAQGLLPYSTSLLPSFGRSVLHLVARAPGRHTPVAQINLGVMYAKGRGVPQACTEAVRLYRLAADQGYAAGPPPPTFNGRLGTVVTPIKPLAAGQVAVRIDGQTKSISLS